MIRRPHINVDDPSSLYFRILRHMWNTSSWKWWPVGDNKFAQNVWNTRMEQERDTNSPSSAEAWTLWERSRQAVSSNCLQRLANVSSFSMWLAMVTCLAADCSHSWDRSISNSTPVITAFNGLFTGISAPFTHIVKEDNVIRYTIEKYNHWEVLVLRWNRWPMSHEAIQPFKSRSLNDCCTLNCTTRAGCEYYCIRSRTLSMSSTLCSVIVLVRSITAIKHMTLQNTVLEIFPIPVSEYLDTIWTVLIQI